MKPTTENIWIEHHKELEGFIRSKVKDQDQSKDILQDVFVKIHTHLDTMKDANKLRQWVFQITRNSINDHFRSQKHFLDAEKIDVKEELIPVNTNQPFAACLSSFVKRLPFKYKEAITKVEFEHMSQHEFAQQLRISYSGAKSRVQRAKEMLRSYFIQCCNVSTDRYGNIIELKGKSNCGICQI